MVDGAPIYTQRSVSVADALTGVPLSGRFHGKMIYVANLKDTATSPVSGAIGYRARVRTHGGADGEGRLRTWFVDNASHVSGSRMPQGEPPVTSSRLVDWDGCIERALAHLIGWVEAGIAPPADSGFTYRDGRVELAARADDRGGIQAVVALTADGSDRASVDPGATVTLEVSAQTPPGTGSVAAVEWDFEGDGNWIAGPASGGDLGTRIKAAVDHVYARRGTFFPSVRVTTHPGAGTDERFCRVTNVARARVVVGDGHGQR
jgi:hypothetical protein